MKEITQEQALDLIVLIYEISIGDHEEFEMDLCKNYLEDHDFMEMARNKYNEQP